MPKTRLGLSLVWIALGCGCNDSPEEQCKDLLGAVCTRLTTCTEELTDTMAPEGFESECVKRSEQGTGGCANAVDVSSSYDTCMDDLEDASCDDFLAISANDEVRIVIPASCTGVIKFESRRSGEGEPRVVGAAF